MEDKNEITDVSIGFVNADGKDSHQALTYFWSDADLSGLK